MSSPPSTTHMTNLTPAEIAAAAERRLQEHTSPSNAQQEIKDHELKLQFRRMIEPGILRPNPRESALASLKVLLTLGENILRDPENPKYSQFKPTNNTIKQRLIDPKGTLEYCRAMGFQPEVENFQPYYKFNPRKKHELELGVAILREVLDLEATKEERAARYKREEKARVDAVATNVKLAFLDDRKTKMQHDERERQRREARKNAPPPTSPTEDETTHSPVKKMPGAGNRLHADVETPENNSGQGNPPPYENDLE